MALRKWMIGLTATLAIGALGVAACGGDDNAIGPGGDDGGGGSDATGSDATTDAAQRSDSSTVLDAGADAETAKVAACQSMMDAFCSRLSPCGFSGLFVSACEAAKSSCPSTAFGEGASMTIDQANACAAQLGTLGCQDLFGAIGSALSAENMLPLRLLSACAVPGTRAGGDSCEWDTQCASLVCSSPESNFATLITGNGVDGRCGTCAPVFGPDDDCTAGLPPLFGGSVCPIGQGCDTTTKRCRTANAGEPCVGNAQSCASGSTCLSNPDGGVGTCEELPAPGSPCSGVSCAGGGYCVYGDDAHDDGGTCAAPVATGAKCTPTARANPTCAGTLGSSICASPDGGVDDFCIPLPTDGKPCRLGSECAFGTFCDNRVLGQETCKSALASGSTCGAIMQTYPDGGPTGVPANPVTCAGECSINCVTIPDAGPTGTCIGGLVGGKSGESCGTDVCTTCAAGSNCVSGTCQSAVLHCE